MAQQPAASASTSLEDATPVSHEALANGHAAPLLDDVAPTQASRPAQHDGAAVTEGFADPADTSFSRDESRAQASKLDPATEASAARSNGAVHHPPDEHEEEADGGFFTADSAGSSSDGSEGSLSGGEVTSSVIEHESAIDDSVLELTAEEEQDLSKELQGISLNAAKPPPLAVLKRKHQYRYAKSAKCKVILCVSYLLHA